MVSMLAFTAALVVIIIILLCQRKTKQGKYRQYASRRNVRTFSNPNYNASGADVGPANPQQEKKSFIWKRLKYDSSQVRLQPFMILSNCYYVYTFVLINVNIRSLCFFSLC